MTKKKQESTLEAIEKILSVKPDEAAIIILRNYKNNDVQQSSCNVKAVTAIMEILFNALQGNIRNFLMQNNILDIDTQLLYLRDLFQSVENQYREFYSKDSGTEADTSKH